MKSSFSRAAMMLAMMLCCLTEARADELTVYDGTDNSSYVPFFGLYVDTQGSGAECVIPGDQLGEMAGGTISAMTFYLKQGAAEAWTGTQQVYVGEVDGTTLTGYTGPTSFTVVKTASFDATGTVLTVEFDEPYTYGGGNLLIGTYVSVAGNYKSAYFYGKNQSEYTGWNRNSAIDSGYGKKFLPKTTFTYEPANTGCDMPTAISVSNITANGATITWEGEGSTWNLRYKAPTDEGYTFVNGLTSKSYTFESNLAENTTYSVGVQTDCGSGSASSFRLTTFTTQNPCSAPTNLQITGITPSSATLSWTPGYQETEWTVKYKKTSDSEYTTETVSGTPTLALSNLDGNTTYNVQVYNCENYVSANFTTLVGIPLNEAFGTATPTGWSMYTGLLSNVMAGTALSTSSGWSFGKSNGVFDNHARVNIYGSNSCYKWLVMPTLAMEDNVQLTFDMALTKYSGTLQEIDKTLGEDDRFVVLITTDGGTTWKILREWNNTGSAYVYNDIACSAVGQAVAIDLSGYAGQSVAVAFYGESTVSETGSDNNLHIDNVSIDYIPDCAKPTGLVKSDVTAHKATITWTSDAAAWQVQLNEEYPIDVTEATYTFENLVPETAYTAKVRTNCGETYSAWTNPVSFTTTIACPAPTNLVGTPDALTATITWDGLGANTWDVAYSTDANANPAENIVETVSVASYSMENLSVDTDYYFWVRANYEEGSSSWVGAIQVHIGYCTPNPSSRDGKGITKVVFGTGDDVVNNVDEENGLPAAAPFYGNYTSMVGAVQAGEEAAVSITYATGSNTVYSYGTIIWVDWDNSMTFEDGEIVYTGTSVQGSNGVPQVLDASFVVPASQVLGDYRMRIAGADSYFDNYIGGNATANHSACFSNSFAVCHDYTLRVLEAPSCLMPTAITADNITTNSAELQWTANGSETAWTVYYKKALDATYTSVETDEKPITLEGLQPATCYEVYVVANCSPTEESSPSSVYRFYTECALITEFPWSEDFDNYDGTSSTTVANNLPQCWYYINTSSHNKGYPYIYNSQYYAHSGSNSLYFNSTYSNIPSISNDARPQYAILPEMQNPNGKYMTLYANGNCAFKVGLMTDPTDASTFTEIATQTASSSNQAYAFQLTGEGNYVAIMIDAASNSTKNVYIDDITIGNCPPPADLTYSPVPGDGTRATLTWTQQNNTATGWEICFDGNENNLVSVSEPTYTATGLTAETLYTAKVRAVNGSEKSGWCNPIYFEPTAKLFIGTGFKTDNYLPTCNSTKYILTQQIYTKEELGEAGLIESISFCKQSTATCNRNIDIYMVGTDKSTIENSTDWVSVTAADKVFSGTVSFANMAWTTITLDNAFVYDGTKNVAIVIDDNTGESVSSSPFLVFDATNQALYNTDYYNDRDPYNPPSNSNTIKNVKNQIRILKSPLGDCIKPTNVKTTEVGPDFATLSWTENGTAEKWVVAYKTAADENFTEVNASTNPYTLTGQTGLSNETEYTVKVRPICDENLWSSEITFTTTVDNPVPTDMAVSDIRHTSATVNWTGFGESYNMQYRDKNIILSEDFENGNMPTGWTNEGDAAWSVGTGDNNSSTGAHGGNKNALITHTTTGVKTYLVTSAMDLSGESGLTLSFWYINRKWTNDIDGFGVYYRVGNGEWNELWSTTENHETWTKQEIALAGFAANYQLGFKMTDGWGYGVGLDDIVIAGNSGEWQSISGLTSKTANLTNLTAGTTYQYQVQSVKGGNASAWSPVAEFTTLSVGTLTEDVGVTYLMAYLSSHTDVHAEFSRSFTANVASTLCLPFPMTTIPGGKAYEFGGVSYDNTDGWVATMNEVSATVANTPYLYKADADANVVFSGTVASDFDGTLSTTTSGDWKFYGTYSRLTYGTAPFNGYVYGFASTAVNDVQAGEFVKADTGAGVPPFRCYLKYKDGEAFSGARGVTRGESEEVPDRITVRLIGKNGETEGIGTLTLSTGEFSTDGWYSLDGRKLDGKPTKKGLYIHDGEKVVIK